jgi:hypothetical protein
MCDVYQPRLEQGIAACGQTAKGVTMMACAAGKDVYVEKPLTVFVKEGRWMTDVARRHKRVVQVGTQRRSGKHCQRAKRHRTTTACHLANLSLRLGRKLKWDAGKEEIIGDREASAMLERPYRKPWDGVLNGLLK